MGIDIAPGTYSRGAVGDGTCCEADGWRWRAHRCFALSKKPQVVTLSRPTRRSQTHGCQPWQNAGGEALPLPGSWTWRGPQPNQLGILNGLRTDGGRTQPNDAGFGCPLLWQ